MIVDVPQIGKVSLDVVFGGMWYANVKIKQLGIQITPKNGNSKRKEKEKQRKEKIFLSKKRSFLQFVFFPTHSPPSSLPPPLLTPPLLPPPPPLPPPGKHSLLPPPLTPPPGKQLVRLGEMIKVATREQFPVNHPEFDYPGVDILVFTEPAQNGNCSKNTVVMSNNILDWNDPGTWTGMLDRSPCGTGTCAVMASLWNKGQLKIGSLPKHS